MKRICLILSIFLIFSNLAAQEEEKRSAIVEVDGYAFLSEDKTIRELRNEATVNARREALQRAQTYIKSFTKVENFTLTYDLIQTEAEGFVKILESKDYGITTDGRYRYWIKAEIEYKLKKPEEVTDINPFIEKGGPLTVKVWTEKNTYTRGENIKICMKGNKDFHARIIYEDARGNIVQLLPNQHRKDNFFKGGEIVTVPCDDDKFQIEVQPPFGIEQITVYASNAELGEAPVQRYGTDFYSVQGGVKDYSARTRGVKLDNREETTRGAEFFEAVCKVKTRNK